MKFVSCFLIIGLASTNVGAVEMSACRAGYAKDFSRKTTQDYLWAKGRNGSGIIAAIGGLTSVAGFSLLKFSSRAIKASKGDLIEMGLWSAGFAGVFFISDSQRRRLAGELVINQFVAGTLDEISAGIEGPRTLGLVGFVNSAIQYQTKLNREVPRAKQKVSSGAIEMLAQTYIGSSPTTKQVQDALRWMESIGFLCNPDNSPPRFSEFEARFAYALNQVVISGSK